MNNRNIRVFIITPIRKSPSASRHIVLVTAPSSVIFFPIYNYHLYPEFSVFRNIFCANFRFIFSFFLSHTVFFANQVSSLFLVTDWPTRRTFHFGSKNIINKPIVQPSKILLPPLHIKFRLMKQFTKAFSKDDD